jgi:hypothetical protein
MRDLGEKTYQVLMASENYKCDTCVQEAFFTLDNAKYWYLVFVYDFMEKCFDMNKLHFIEGDTDSAYWAVAGDPDLPTTQAFQSVITDKELYDKHIFEFAPYDFFCFNEESRPVLTSKLEKKQHEKKLLGLAIEKQGENMIALCPKCYTSWSGEKQIALKCKGVSTKQNKDITRVQYQEVVEKGVKFDGQNITLQLKDGKMKRLTMSKVALSGKHTKAIVQENGACMPFIFQN